MKIKTLRKLVKIRQNRHAILSAFTVVFLFTVYQNCGTKAATTTQSSNGISGTTTAATNTVTTLAVIYPASYAFTATSGTTNAVFSVTNASAQVLRYLTTSFTTSGGGYILSDYCNGLVTLASGSQCLVTIAYPYTTTNAAMTAQLQVNYTNASGVTQSALVASLAGPSVAIAANATPTPASVGTGSAGDVIPIYRSYKAGEHFLSRSATEGPANGFTAQGIAFYLFPYGFVTGTHPIYRCYNRSKHFSSLDVGCEGFLNEGLLGYAYNDSSSGGLPLARYYSNGDHLTTTNVPEASNNGFALEGPQGFVPNSFGGTSGTTPGSVGSGRYVCDALYGTVLFRTWNDDMPYAKNTSISRCNNYASNAAECTNRAYCKDTTTGLTY